MKLPKVVTIDFETFGIEARPKYPPRPVGVSIKIQGGRSKYYAFNHPTKNNCTEAQAKAALKKVWNNKDGLLFQNGKFDIDVAMEHWGFPMPKWNKIHDTMFLLFLDDPNQRDLGLKPAAERLLGEPPEEQDALCDWLLEHQPIPFIKISKSKKSDHYFGKYIAYTPGDLCGKYARGDTDRTYNIFKLLYPTIVERDMHDAYDRERRLMPILLDMERRGVPVNLRQLRKDVKNYGEWQKKIDAWIIKRIKAPSDINLDSGAQLVDAMIASGKADETKMPLTPTGKIQTNKNSLLAGVTDKTLLSVLRYRSQLNTCMNTFMKPWLATAEASDGLIFTNWNQVKHAEGSGAVGTRTGRLSSTPNFQNIPNEFKPLFRHEQRGLPKCPWDDLPPLPRVRSYIIPFPGHILIDRDYSQQEPRILAHFDGGELMDIYVEDPWVDFHDKAKDELETMGLFYDRKPVKNTNLGTIYGMGIGKLAEQNGMPVDESKKLKNAIMRLYPGLKEMYNEMRIRSQNDEPIRTWGGREYYCEPPKMVKGRMMKFDYKMVNTLIQGSAADCTKQAIIQFDDGRKDDWYPLLNVHDQITASVPIPDFKEAMEFMREAMEDLDFDVPMLSEGSASKKNWAELKDTDKKGVAV